MLAYWPNKTLPNTVNTTPLIIEDFFPSIMEMAEIKEAQFPQIVDGQSFVSLLDGAVEENNKRPLFWHYPNEWGPEGPGIGSYSAVRQGDWKLIYFHTDQSLELYNLNEDIYENLNLVESKAKKTKELAQVLTAHLQEVKAQMPTDKITGEIVPWPTSLLHTKK